MFGNRFSVTGKVSSQTRMPRGKPMYTMQPIKETKAPGTSRTWGGSKVRTRDFAEVCWKEQRNPQFFCLPWQNWMINSLERAEQTVPGPRGPAHWEGAPHWKEPSVRTREAEPQQPGSCLPGRRLGMLPWGIWLLGFPSQTSTQIPQQWAPHSTHTPHPVLRASHEPFSTISRYLKDLQIFEESFNRKDRETRTQEI